MTCTLHRRVRIACAARGWTIAELATRARTPESTIAGVLTGHRQCTDALARRLATALGVSVDVLLAGPPEHLADVEIADRDPIRTRIDVILAAASTTRAELAAVEGVDAAYLGRTPRRMSAVVVRHLGLPVDWSDLDLPTIVRDLLARAPANNRQG